MIFEKKRTLFRLLRGFSITFQSRDLEKFKQKFWTIILGFSSWEHDEFYCSDRRFTILVRASCNSNGLTPPCRQGSCGLWFSHSFSRDFKSRTPNLRNTRNISVKKKSLNFFFVSNYYSSRTHELWFIKVLQCYQIWLMLVLKSYRLTCSKGFFPTLRW